MNGPKLDSLLNNLEKTLSEHFLVVGAIIAVEPHKNSSLHSKRGKNTKAGSPHFHLVVWLCHQFHRLPLT